MARKANNLNPVSTHRGEDQSAKKISDTLEKVAARRAKDEQWQRNQTRRREINEAREAKRQSLAQKRQNQEAARAETDAANAAIWAKVAAVREQIRAVRSQTRSAQQMFLIHRHVGKIRRKNPEYGQLKLGRLARKHMLRLASNHRQNTIAKRSKAARISAAQRRRNQ